ncbi:muscarinic acetylcholine receptor M1-like [Strongylocentrotus purpuratus]|uniref:G-protein coupled receptors family 1 profile domain-containing protein n=1 Tax=Strongylocentrotus purpuratus TaxID=7668 RepID=A0A7M7SVW3_STRPU|nr:muscarinic acetylcholine receptor M1-like [Strongylocentrotus purpuratus]
MDKFNSTTELEGGLSSMVQIIVAIVVSLVVSLVVAATVMGNLLVMIAFFTTRRLRTYNNHFILGLAIADFLVGAIGMPMFGVVFIMGRWPFSATFCDIFSYCDHAFSHISVVSVMIISLDRFVATVYPLHHRSHWRRRSQAVFLISIAFLVPLITWAPPTLLWNHVYGGGGNSTSATSEDCLPDYLLSDHGGEVTHLNGHIPTEMSTTDAEPKETNGNDTLRELIEKDVEPSGKASKPGCSKNATRRTSTKTTHYALEHKDQGEAIDPKAEEFRIRTLGFIIMAMFITWVPWAVIVIILSLCEDCIPEIVYSHGKPNLLRSLRSEIQAGISSSASSRLLEIEAEFVHGQIGHARNADVKCFIKAT